VCILYVIFILIQNIFFNLGKNIIRIKFDLQSRKAKSSILFKIPVMLLFNFTVLTYNYITFYLLKKNYISVNNQKILNNVCFKIALMIKNFIF
jgi:hypothetical protein